MPDVFRSGYSKLFGRLQLSTDALMTEDQRKNLDAVCPAFLTSCNLQQSGMHSYRPNRRIVNLNVAKISEDF